MSAKDHRAGNTLRQHHTFRRPAISFALISVCLWLIFLFSCTKQPTDIRSLVPADTLVYLESNDLAATLQPILDSKAFREASTTQPDLTSLKGVRIAVAITGFETKEEKLNDEQSVGKVQPHFVAVIDTHAWNSAANAFVEKNLGSFVEDIYDSKPKLEKSDKDGGKSYTWTAEDGRKAFAVVIDGLVYFANDASAIDKCLAVKRGESDSFASTGKLPSPDKDTLASGYVSTEGVARIADLAALKFASDASDEFEIQSAIAGLLPKLVRESISEIRWTCKSSADGIIDSYNVELSPTVAAELSDSFRVKDSTQNVPFQWVPSGASSATRYNLGEPERAWGSVLAIVQKLLDPSAAGIFKLASGSFFEPYGIADPEKFFDSGVSVIETANFSDDGDRPVMMASTFVDEGKLHASLLPGLRDQKRDGIRQTEDGETAAFQLDLTLVAGESQAIRSLYPYFISSERKNSVAGVLPASVDKNAMILTYGTDNSSATGVAKMFSGKDNASRKVGSRYFVETSVSKSGITRKTTSEIGFVGWLIAQFGNE